LSIHPIACHICLLVPLILCVWHFLPITSTSAN
jgi:hypothetical protein